MDQTVLADILVALWPNLQPFPPDRNQRTLPQYARFLNHVSTELNTASQVLSTDSALTRNLLLTIPALLHSRLDALREAVLQQVSELCKAEATVPPAIDIWPLVRAFVYLWLGLDVHRGNDFIRITLTEAGAGNTHSLAWHENVSLRSLVESHFATPLSKAKIIGSSQVVAVDPMFTMAHLVNYYGFRIYWTSNLLEHLSISWKFKILSIYEHKICLWNHIVCGKDTPVPRFVFEEALDTLNLLFPFDDAGTKSLLQKEGVSFYSLGLCGRDRVLDLNKYQHWRAPLERLVELQSQPPSGLSQLRWNKDGRNALQFATFWIATTVAVLTIFSFAFGILSTMYAKKGYDVAMLQYELALAQACAAEGSALQLPSFC
jgi:hypothetical protein